MPVWKMGNEQRRAIVPSLSQAPDSVRKVLTVQDQFRLRVHPILNLALILILMLHLRVLQLSWLEVWLGPPYPSEIGGLD
jgi:Na+/H+ antiporter NhaB